MSEAKALETVKNYIEAFNAQNLDDMRANLNFPFSWITNDRMIPVLEESKFRPPTEALIRDEGWHHTELDVAEPLQIWDTKVHFKIVYSRFKADGSKYVSHEALWIVTSNKGHWGIQCMSLYIPQ